LEFVYSGQRNADRVYEAVDPMLSPAFAAIIKAKLVLLLLATTFAWPAIAITGAVMIPGTALMSATALLAIARTTCRKFADTSLAR